jgi:DNA-directed RNA polymerase subunit omega
MARITIEDCIEKVPNRFHLVQMAAIRAKQLKQGATSLVAAEDNKAVVIALREIAAGRVHPDYPEGHEELADSGAGGAAAESAGEAADSE